MQGYDRNNQSTYADEIYNGRDPDQYYPSSYRYPLSSSQAIMNRRNLESYDPLSDYELRGRYDLYDQRDHHHNHRLPSMRERLAVQKLHQNGLRNFQAGHDRRSMSSSSNLPYWACPCGSSGYDHTAGNCMHDRDHLAGRLGHISHDSYSDLSQDYHHGAGGSSYSRGTSGRTGFSLGESLPRSKICKNDQQLSRRSRANTASDRFCLQNCQQPFSGSNNLYSSRMAYGAPAYAGRPWLDEGMAGRLRRASSGTSLASYGCGY